MGGSKKKKKPAIAASASHVTLLAPAPVRRYVVDKVTKARFNGLGEKEYFIQWQSTSQKKDDGSAGMWQRASTVQLPRGTSEADIPFEGPGGPETPSTLTDLSTSYQVVLPSDVAAGDPLTATAAAGGAGTREEDSTTAIKLTSRQAAVLCPSAVLRQPVNSTPTAAATLDGSQQPPGGDCANFDIAVLGIAPTREVDELLVGVTADHPVHYGSAQPEELSVLFQRIPRGGGSGGKERDEESHAAARKFVSALSLTRFRAVYPLALVDFLLKGSVARMLSLPQATADALLGLDGDGE